MKKLGIKNIIKYMLFGSCLLSSGCLLGGETKFNFDGVYVDATAIDVRAEDQNGQTPLHAATWQGRRGAVEVLLGRGADVNAKGEDIHQLTPLYWAVGRGSLENVRLLLANGADPRIVDAYGRTPFHEAARRSSPEIAELLLEHGADVNAKDNKLVTSLHLAARRSSPEIVELLLEHNADVNAKDNGLVAPLHLAAYCGCLRSAKLLLRAGAKIDAVTRNGRTALDVARIRGKVMVAGHLSACIQSRIEIGSALQVFPVPNDDLSEDDGEHYDGNDTLEYNDESDESNESDKIDTPEIGQGDDLGGVALRLWP
jgi:ankyrin repeat protein